MTPASEGSPARPSDIAALTARMVQGEDFAYREFYRRYFDRLLRYLFVVTGGNEQAARDALQAAFLRAVRHMKRFESEEHLWSWLTVLAKSAAIDQQRKESRYQRLLRRCFQTAPPPSPASPRNPDALILELLDLSVRNLTSEERELVERKYFAKQPVRDIAAALDSTEKAIESRLVRLRRKLKELILKQLRDENQP